MSRATIYSIADSLGISASTVSRAMTRPEMVKEDVRLRVLQRAEEMGYQPNRSARRLATGRTGAIGLLVPDITNPYFPPLFRAIQAAAAGADGGTSVVLADTEGSAQDEPALIQRLRGQVDGLILASPLASDEELVAAIGSMPAVVLNRHLPALHNVLYDTSQALSEAGEHLRALGHQHVALLEGTPGSWAAEERSRAVQSWAAGAGVELTVLGPFEASYAGGRAAATELLDTDATAAFAFDDLVACGVVAGIFDSGEKVPKTRSVIGCDDILLAQVLSPTLSTVNTNQDSLGEAAINLLQQAMAAEPPSVVHLQARFIPRQSTGKAPSAN